MMRQLLIVAMLAGATLTTTIAHANDFAQVDDQGGDKPKKKKEKKEKGDKPAKEKGDKPAKEKKPAVKPEAFSLTGKLNKTEKNNKAFYELETDDGTIALKGKKVAELDEHTNKTISISGTGKMMENDKGKSLVIVKLEGATAQ